jgi:hypothetical protein
MRMLRHREELDCWSITISGESTIGVRPMPDFDSESGSEPGPFRGLAPSSRNWREVIGVIDRGDGNSLELVVQPLQSSTESIRCDHCRKPLGLMVHRYWRMRFCSAACLRAYQSRLNELTMIKIAHLDPARVQSS